MIYGRKTLRNDGVATNWIRFELIREKIGRKGLMRVLFNENLSRECDDRFDQKYLFFSLLAKTQQCETKIVCKLCGVSTLQIVENIFKSLGWEMNSNNKAWNVMMAHVSLIIKSLNFETWNHFWIFSFEMISMNSGWKRVNTRAIWCSYPELFDKDVWKSIVQQKSKRMECFITQWINFTLNFI